MLRIIHKSHQENTVTLLPFHYMLRRIMVVIACAVLAPWAAKVAHAQAYPSKPIRMIVPLAVGSAVDVAARLIAARMSQSMGQPIVVENVVGAAGIIGAGQLAKAAPDGYTIGGFNDSILTMVPNLNSNTPFNPLTDFVHVSRVAIIEFSIAVPSNSPWNNAADLVAAAKAAPGRYTFASGGNGSPQHLGGALFASHTGIDIKHIPYRGASQAAQDVAGGQVDMTFQGIATVAALAKGGKIRLIGVMADQRHPEYPDTPTLRESGIRGFDYSTWFGLTLPKGTPKEITERLNAEVVKALSDPDLKQRFAAVGLRPEGSSSQAMTNMVRDQLTRYGKAIKDSGIKGD